MVDTSVEPFAQLVSLTDLDSPAIVISKSPFVIGRHPDCDIPLVGNKYVSRCHCSIKQHEAGVLLEDDSANGTLLNKEVKLSKYEREAEFLKHGDEFYVVYKKHDPLLNVGYIYQELKELKKEEEEEELTQEYDVNVGDSTLVDDDLNLVPSPDPKLKRSKSVEAEEPPSKRSKSGDEESREKPCEGKEDQKVKSEPKEDALAETLQCMICQEILHDCISLQPCMHSFCSGCYSDWMKRSDICPTCRLKVERINKNHIVNNLVEAYLKEHPDKRRPEEDIKELESKNTVTRDMLYPKRSRDYSSDSESLDETDDYSDSEPIYPTIPTTHGPLVAVTNQVWGFGATVRPPKTVCRQCPEYKEPCVGVGPSTSGTDGSKTMPCPPQFVCQPNQNHILCLCCMQPMPDRRIEMQTNPNIPPQQCSLCKSGFCHAYWGCRKVNCDGCLAKFKDLNFGKKCLDNLVLDNFAESEILKNYLESKNISIKELLKICLEKKDTGVYDGRATNAEVNLNSNSVLCYGCGIRNFKEFVYQYRCDIPKEDLPDAVNKRPDCYWGKNCRTQKNKPQHATRYNHICEQTRTS